MTDKMGNLHHNTLPVGGMDPSAWGKYVVVAKEEMCAPFAEVVSKAKEPFVTAINDVSCPGAVALDGKVLITGEALNLMRPHMALSTTQSAMQALELEKVLRGEISLKQWEKNVLRWGKLGALKTNAFGFYHLYGAFAAAGWVFKFIGALIGIY